MTVNSVTIPRWFDRHLHVRDDDMLKTVLPCTLRQRATGAVIMPNLFNNPITTIAKAKAYRDRINEVRNDYFMRRVPFIGSGEDQFKPCMTLYLTDEIEPEEVVSGYKEGYWQAVKLYMANQNGEGGTTGSAHGVRKLSGRHRVFEAMEKHRIPLLGHFEAVEDDIDEFDREAVSTDRDLKPLIQSFPGLPIVFEHVTDGRAADFIAEVDHEIYTTVTVQQLMNNRNAMFRGGMNPGYYCRPVPKREEHRLRVRKYVTSGHLRFGAGTDSAPHDEESVKCRCYGCGAGIFTALTAVELYAIVFDEDNKLENLGPFLSENFVELYGMKVSSETMTLERSPLIVPQKIGGVQVFKGGTELPWRLVG